MKKLLTLVLCICLIMLSSAQVFASDIIQYQNVNIVPRMDYISRASSDIAIDSNGKATINCSIYGYQTITAKVSITAELQQYNSGKWEIIGTYTVSSDSYRVSLSESKNVAKGYTYRVVAVVKAYSGTNSETQTVTSSETKY